MEEYYVDPEQIDKESTFVLVEAVARYMSIKKDADVEVIAAILGIKKQK